ncbi:uncharacterized protein LOC118300242 isoform X1 [Scophthalmus maximus]|uniref:uncharacterized protein LOC118300242 isoform X1 n=1 Tax=Scophthalmus maximus TaxID=52904 RepID=UPI001FA9233C|nr:uncharacterized protein LOC118300242 isoform X1 [Scophthalmus maximus]
MSTDRSVQRGETRDDDDSTMSVHDFCRFCERNLKISGTFSHSTKIFEKSPKTTVFDRLVEIGLTLKKTPERSRRICNKCVTTLTRLERDLTVFRRWADREDANSSTGEGGSSSGGSSTPRRETAPSGTQLYQPGSVQGRAGGKTLPKRGIDTNSAWRCYRGGTSCQTDPPERTSAGTQLSMKTLQNHVRSKATQTTVASKDCGVCTLTFPLDSPMLFLQPTIARRPSKRPRLSLTDEEDGPSE